MKNGYSWADQRKEAVKGGPLGAGIQDRREIRRATTLKVAAL
jgi:hypothetical protein